MDSGQKISITPEELAQAFFLRVRDDIDTVLAKHDERFKKCPSFQPNRFERRKFLYLVADMAIALMTAARQQPALEEVIPHFRRRVLVTMEKYWGDTESEADAEIEQASFDYAKLLSVNPNENRGFSLDWTHEWLGHIGIDETNPVVLIGIASTWRLFHAHTLKCLSSISITDRKSKEGRNTTTSQPPVWIAANILALSAAQWWDSQLDPFERLEHLNRMYWRLKRRRCRPLREIYDHRDIARCLKPKLS